MTDILMRKFEAYILEDQSYGTPPDSNQVPATGATIAVARQGASVTTQVTCQDGQDTDVAVADAGRLIIGDIVQVGTIVGRNLSVDAISGDGHTLSLSPAQNGDITLNPGDRLVPLYGTPNIFADGAGARSLNGNTTQLDATGHAKFYCPESHVDVFVSGGGLPTLRLVQDLEGGWMSGGQGWLNVTDYLSIQDAIDALPREGGTVFIPAGTYNLTDTLYTPCDRPCHLVGDGDSPSEGQGTTLKWSPDAGTWLGMLRVRGSNSSVRKLRLWNTGESVPTGTDESVGYGLFVGRRDVADAHPLPGQTSGTEYVKMGRSPLGGMLIEDVTISGAQGWGLTIPGFGVQSNGAPEVGAVPTGNGEGGTLNYSVSLRRVRIEGARKYGGTFVGTGCTTIWFEESAILGQGREQASGNGNYYAYLMGCVQAVFSRCTFEGTSPTQNPWVAVVSTESVKFDACWFEDDGWPTQYNPGPTYFVELTDNNRASTVSDCHFVRDSGSAGLLRLIQIDANGAHGVLLANPYAVSGDSLVLNEDLGVLVDAVPIDLNGPTNTGVVVASTGVCWDQTHGGRRVPLLYAGAANDGSMLGAGILKVPEVSTTMFDYVHAPAGCIALAQDLPAPTALRYLSAGDSNNWKLANNCPTLSSEGRDAYVGWSQGDMIFNSDIGKLQVSVGTSWRSLEWSTE